MHDQRRSTCFAMLLCAAGITLALPGFADGESGPAPRSGPGLAPAALEVWNDPLFQKRFAESYRAETEIEPTVTADELKKMQEALDMIRAEKLEQAAAFLRKELARNPAASAVFDFTLGNICFQMEKLDEAAADYAKAVDKYDKFRRAWKNLAMVHVRRGEFKDALPALTRVVELGGGDALTYGLLGFAGASVGDYLAAESAYRMAVLLDPKTLDWRMGLARSFFKQERFAEAAALCGQLIRDHPERADLWLLEANAYIGMNQPQRAVENYELVDQLGRSTPESLYMLGDIYVNEELYGRAVEAYGRAMEKSPEAGPARALRAARVLAARGALPELRTLLQDIDRRYGKGLSVPDRTQLLKLRARLAVAEGRAGEDVAVLEEIVALDPMDGEALILLGQSSSRRGDVDKAIFYFERAAGLEKFEADARLRHAQLLVARGDYEAALPLLRRAQQLEPRENVARYLEQVERFARSR